MKTVEWLAVLVIAFLVGAVTFGVVYFSSEKTYTDPATFQEPPPSLTFASKHYPEEKSRFLTSEVHREGHQDYWFVNDSDKEVQVGLSGKSCTCASVEISVVNDYWKPRLLAQAGARLLQRAVCRLEHLPTWAATYEPDRVFVEVPEDELKTTRFGANEVAAVPAGALGWVRIGWRREQPEAMILRAALWMGHPDSSVYADLEASVRILESREAQK